MNLGAVFILSSLEKWQEFQVVGKASDGREAVRKSQELQPDLILLDIGLPTMNGIEAAREIRQLLPNPKILCCSENRSADVAEAAFRAGAGGYLVKSDAGSDLLSAVISVIQGNLRVVLLGARISLTLQISGLVRNQDIRVLFPNQVIRADGLGRAMVDIAIEEGESRSRALETVTSE